MQEPTQIVSRRTLPAFLSLAVLVLLPVRFGGAATQDDSLCRLLHAQEISDAFAGKLSVEVERSNPDGCVYTIQERSMSQLHAVHFEAGSAGDSFDGQKRMLQEGAIEGELLDDLGEEAVLNLTNQFLVVRLPDDSVLQFTIRIYGEALLGPLLDDEEKREGLLQIGRLAVSRIGS